MKYDVSGHLPSQIDGLIQGFQKADIPLMERSLDNIRNLVKDSKLKDALDGYKNARLDKVAELEKKALDAAKTIRESKTFSDLYIDLEEIKNDLLAALEQMEREYWNTVKELITSYVNEETPSEKTEETDE